MLIGFLLVLATIRVSESVEGDGLRKSRQLDLGLQDIRNPDGETPTTVPLKDDVINGYLPPVSSLSPEVVSSQSQQTFDVKSVNSVGATSDLCKPTFDNGACDFKLSSTSDSKIPKPSRDLVPPFNDLEQELANKATTLSERTNEESRTTIIFTATTGKPTTRIFKAEPTQNIVRITKTTKRPVASTAEATNELRNYLPPQPDISSAAQTNIAVVQPASQNNADQHHDHHHHHGHHHDENFNICEDAFHAFLCAPLKARKRITGALPSSLLGQSSFINYQRALLNPDRETAPSNTFNKEYLPPKLSPTNLIQSTYLPPFTTRKPIVTTTTTTTTPRPYSTPKFIPESSISNERFYLPPLTDNFPVKPAPSNQAFSTIKPTTPTPTPFSIKPSRITQNSFIPSAPTVPIINPLSSNTNNFYLPPAPNPQHAASFLSASKNTLPIISTISPLDSTYIPVPTVTSFAPLASNSIIISQKPKLQPTTPTFKTTKRPPPPVELRSYPTTTIRVPTFASQTSNPSGSYLPPNEFQSSSQPVPTTVKPATSTFKFSEQASNADRSYLPPDPNEPAAAQISSAAVAPPNVKNPFHHGRDLCTDPFHSFLCVSAKPRKRITGQLPSGYKPESSNTNESRLKPDPSNQNESRVRAEKHLEAAQAQNVGYKYPKPVNPLPTPSNTVVSTVAPTTGYFYPKPEKLFPLPSQQDVKIAQPSSTTTKKPEAVFRTSEAKLVAGYDYPKPDKIFPPPAGEGNNKVNTATNPPTTGYSYPKPQKLFPLPTEQNEVRQKPKQKVPTPSLALPTNTVKGYQYPKPEQSLKLPEKKGYIYPKPEKRLELPTETLGSKHKLPQSHSNLEALGNLGSAEFIPVNKLDLKRGEASNIIERLRRFGERMKKRERHTQLYKKQPH